jgi:2-C-methyl-D-erythritol 4-phosphate cytidylyltransferase
MSDGLILVAGGSGTRMGTQVPKQFLMLGAKPVLLHTLEKFYAADSELEIVIVLPATEQERWKTICKEHQVNIPHNIVDGGNSRSASVANGLQSCKAQGIIAVHDAVRPLLSIDLIRQCFDTAKIHGSAVPSVSLKDTIRKVDKEKSKHAERSDFRLIQTPQCFRSDMLRMAYSLWDGVSVTDDAGLVEQSGEEIHLCQGEDINIKITDQMDLIIANSVISLEGNQG